MGRNDLAVRASAPHSAFGEELRRLRTAAGLTREQLAEQADLSAKAIGALERGERQQPHPRTVIALATALGLADTARAALMATLPSPGRSPTPAVHPAPCSRTLPLQVPLTPLIGRADDVTAVANYLRQGSRLVTLVGPGGVGKSSLALAVTQLIADSFVDGVVCVPLAPLQDPALVVPTLAEVLALREVGSTALIATVQAYLQDKHLLLVLDNFEHVRDAAPAVAALLATSRLAQVLVTSRTPLHVRGEQQYPVHPLALPALEHVPLVEEVVEAGAVQLFVQRAREVQPTFELTQANVAAVAAICRRLDGLPLALELAAAWVKLLGPTALLARLDQALPVLVGGARDLPERQQTLRDTVAWSYNLLQADEQRLFRRLAVFAGGCTIAAAKAVCSSVGSPDLNILAGLAVLVDQSLLEQTEALDGEPRFAMLETIREYGREQLAASREVEAMQQRHAAFFLSLAEEVAPQLRGPQHVARLGQLAVEHDNLRAALHWMLEREDSDGSLRLSSALWSFWEIRGHLSEGRHWLRAALALPGSATASIRVDAFLAAGHLAADQGDGPHAVALFAQGLVLSRDLGGRERIAQSLSSQGWLALMRGEYTGATMLLEENVTLFREIGDPQGLATALSRLGQAAYEQGDFVRAIPVLTESVEIFRAIGYHLGAAWSLNKLGLVALYQGNLTRAAPLIEESLAIFHVLEYKGGIAWGLGSLGWVTLSQGDDVRAAGLFEDSLAHYSELGDKRNIAFGLERLASLAGVRGHAVRAARLFGAAATLRNVSAVPLPPVDRDYYAPYLAAAQAKLGAVEFATAWAEGEALSLAQAIAFALHHVDV